VRGCFAFFPPHMLSSPSINLLPSPFLNLLPSPFLYMFLLLLRVNLSSPQSRHNAHTHTCTLTYTRKPIPTHPTHLLSKVRGRETPLRVLRARVRGAVAQRVRASAECHWKADVPGSGGRLLVLEARDRHLRQQLALL